MSKADTLGSAPAFGAARGARSSRRNLIDKTIAGQESTEAAITELPVTLISDNPDNPRNHLRNLDETVQTVREVGIIIPIAVATVDAYLRNRPDRVDDIDDGAQYIVVDGHRRLESARRVGMATIPVRVDNGRVATDESLLEAAFVANYHRDDMTDLEEAHALKTLVDYYGSQTKAAKRLGIPQNTISSKLSLLKLTPELQKDLVTGARKVEHVRNLGKLSPEEQKAKADERAEAARLKAEARPQEVVERSADPADYHGVIIPEAPTVPTAPTAPVGPATPVGSAAPPSPPIRPSAASLPAGREPTPESIPEPRTGAGEPGAATEAAPSKQPKQLPYDDAFYCVHHLHRKMKPETFVQGARMWMDILREQHPDEYKTLLAELGAR
ncbi:ParB/RepB/Spo0J family partition protein [Streptomyces capillispiralis]|uniref:ParB family chromosome partitioning protein n=1 Tax=Streptomyces capillispiralis TaxID=68182 RepID=A0A561SGW5_9ACTN|nr:ParB/RepB/Spo0J family partition protein [Streptomyces capillispiralis]TWF74057.1 ParB family chromosome partitioning protein [Streptomyces capillispiralis]GHH96438.1 plasmid partitioning protein [Streptomyces capillispiralis]